MILLDTVFLLDLVYCGSFQLKDISDVFTPPTLPRQKRIR